LIELLLPRHFVTVSYMPPGACQYRTLGLRSFPYKIALFQLEEFGDAFVLVDVVEVGNDALAVCGALQTSDLVPYARAIRTSLEHFAAAVASLSIGRVRAGIVNVFHSS
jgi:hypothetical protein